MSGGAAIARSSVATGVSGLPVAAGALLSGGAAPTQPEAAKARMASAATNDIVRTRMWTDICERGATPESLRRNDSGVAPRSQMSVHMRVLTISLVAALAILAFAASGCVGAAPPDSSAPAATGKPDTPVATDDLAMAAPPDMAEPVWDLAPPKLPPDFASSDLAGYTNCYGATVCDPTTSFCIKYHSGNQAMP